MTDFYSNAEDDDEDDVDQSTALEIELCIKQGSDKSTKIVDSVEEEDEEYDTLSFWKKMHSSYPVLSKVAARSYFFCTGFQCSC